MLAFGAVFIATAIVMAFTVIADWKKCPIKISKRELTAELLLSAVMFMIGIIMIAAHVKLD
ncbi:MAG: hypothetical protein ACI4IG_05135 [Eubacterium sp.]